MGTPRRAGYSSAGGATPGYARVGQDGGGGTPPTAYCFRKPGRVAGSSRLTMGKARIELRARLGTAPRDKAQSETRRRSRRRLQIGTRRPQSTATEAVARRRRCQECFKPRRRRWTTRRNAKAATAEGGRRVRERVRELEVRRRSARASRRSALIRTREPSAHRSHPWITDGMTTAADGFAREGDP